MSRSTPYQTIIPALRYADAPAAIRWLCGAFGFREHFVAPGEEGRIDHAQLDWRGSLVMLGSQRGVDGHDHLSHTAGHGSISLTAESAAQVDQLYASAQQAGAQIVYPLEDTEYGSHAFTAADPEGNLWHFGTYDPLAPAAPSD